MKDIINDYNNNMSIKDICEKHGISAPTLYKRLHKHGIVRGSAESNKRKFLKKHNISKKLLQDLYYKQEKTIKVIATELGKSVGTIRSLFKIYNIKTRSVSEHLAIDQYNKAHSENMRKVALSRLDEISKASKEQWIKRGGKAHPNLLKKMRSKGYRGKMREMMLNRHKTKWHDNIKPLISAGLSKCWANNDKFRDSISKHASKIMDKIRQDKEAYNKWHKSLVSALNSDEYKLKRSIIVKKLWLNNHYRLAQSKKSKKLWQTDEYRTKQAEARSRQPIISSQQIILYNILDSLNIKFIPEYSIGPYSFDCFIPDHNLLIEVNGDYWHSLSKAIRNDKSKSTFIERYYPNMILKYIWEHEFKCVNRIIELIKYWCNIINHRINYNLRDISMNIIDTPTAKSFISAYHYKNKIGNNSLRLGFFVHDKLIAIIIFGNIVRHETAKRLNLDNNEVWELSRFSTIISMAVRYVRNNIDRIKALVTFADTTFNHSGVIYKASNWILDGEVKPSYWYVDTDGWVMHKKTLYDHAKSLKMSEIEFAEKKGYTRVHGNKKFRYIYYLNNKSCD